jgi:hypothetical protein
MEFLFPKTFQILNLYFYLLWFEYEMLPRVSCAWSPAGGMLFWEVVLTLGGGAQLEEVNILPPVPLTYIFPTCPHQGDGHGQRPSDYGHNPLKP